VEISKVLKAMAVPMEYARGTVRFSTGKSTTIEEIDRAVEIVEATVRRLKT
jgi:cysteine desulfurase